MKRLLSFFILLSIKIFSGIFYRFDIGWPDNNPDIAWDKIKLVIFLNHTSLYEFLYIGFLPTSFLKKLSKRMVAPAADKTLNRPVVGFFFKLFSPGLISITRKKDGTWEHFLDCIHEDSIIVIVPEGRMKRKNGLDLEGKKMTVRSGVVDILAGLDKGQMIFAYSGGLHHVQIPDEGLPHLFKTLKLDLESFEITRYKAMFNEPVGTEAWKKLVLEDLQLRLETNVPV